MEGVGCVGDGFFKARPAELRRKTVHGSWGRCKKGFLKTMSFRVLHLLRF